MKGGEVPTITKKRGKNVSKYFWQKRKHLKREKVRMQRRRILLLTLLSLTCDLGFADVITKDNAGSNTQNDNSQVFGGRQVKLLKEKDNPLQFQEDAIRDSIKSSKLEMLSETQTMFSHRDPYTTNLQRFEKDIHKYNYSVSSSGSTQRPLLRSHMKLGTSNPLQNSTKTTIKDVRIVATLIHSNKRNINNSHKEYFRNTSIQNPKAYRQLKPTVVMSTSPKAELGSIQKSTMGVLITPKGNSRVMEETFKNKQKTTNIPSLSKHIKQLNKTSEIALSAKALKESVQKLSSISITRNGTRLSRAMLHKLTSRPSKKNFKRDSGRIKNKVARKRQKIVKKNTSNMEADTIISDEEDTDPASPSVPLVIITTQTPLVKKMIHKKRIESSKTYKPPSFKHRGSDGFHDPLYSMYGPPYDHYKISAHRSPGRSFPPPPLPLYHSDHEFFHERFIQTQVPHLLPSMPEKRINDSDYLLPPYFREDSVPFVTPAPSLTLKPPTLPPSSNYNFVFPKKKISKELSYEGVTPYFHPDESPIKKKTYSITKAKIKSINPITTKSPSKSYPVTRYSAISDGRPGVDYPVYARIPYTSFSCKDNHPPGIYGDPEAGCQVWHMCEADGRQHSFLCPNGTIFNQELLTCDWWYNVHCSYKTDHFYKEPVKDTYDPHPNYLPTTSDKRGNIKFLPENQKKSNWSPYSNLNLTKRLGKDNHIPPSTHLEQKEPILPDEKPSILSPRGIKGRVTPITGGFPYPFVEFQPYHQDTYPMFHLRKRHIKHIV
ncbi:hypothetical protein SK128_018353 [Halocaridina rubra]|uniref:Chitin-binding type-2 domain-containing protein n=1 Tax=Halocaridina rubra TaxID=373956 RepID=A0AAN8WQZ9_HALRR